MILDGIDLEPEVVSRIARAVQKAALTELASLDLQGDFAARLAIGNGGTQGMQFAALTTDQVRGAGLDETFRQE